MCRVKRGVDVEASPANLRWAATKNTSVMGARTSSGTKSTSHNQSSCRQALVTHHRLSQRQVEIGSISARCIFYYNSDPLECLIFREWRLVCNNLRRLIMVITENAWLKSESGMVHRDCVGMMTVIASCWLVFWRIVGVTASDFCIHFFQINFWISLLQYWTH